jgi:hypothetical protein
MLTGVSSTITGREGHTRRLSATRSDTAAEAVALMLATAPAPDAVLTWLQGTADHAASRRPRVRLVLDLARRRSRD